ncbi:ATP-binding cassette domain-containing protein [Bacillus cereus group sp. BfR-BA-01380]|uniref:ATP-binding cassette domain-containing protein n=1 Tax=Bacillus cereus group sp. BfR-BA-01380 TaxID=2920324 RepID=UPI001F579747|nr:ABC transporter ATP-binding protein [Bacillus cereus group sp. BfR-BA-01380]
MLALDIRNVNKKYQNFELKDVSFQLEKGYIMGFIGANGAGKITTIKSILNMIHLDSGEARILGKNIAEHDIELKQEIGYAFSGIDFYTRNKIKTLTNVIKKFYTNWDDETYYNYLRRFKLDENKKIVELSTGMKVKYSLALALSHGAKLLILDEPTSGLDLAARVFVIVILELLHIVSAIIFGMFNIRLYPNQTYYLFASHMGFWGLCFVMLAIFNIIFISVYYYIAYKYSEATFASVTAAMVFAGVAQWIGIQNSFVFDIFNGSGADNMALQISILIAGIVIFISFTMIAYRIAYKRFLQVEIQ